MSNRKSLAETLAHIVREHGHACEVTKEGTLIAEHTFTVKQSDGTYRASTEREPIAANVKAVRNWLGY